MSSSTTSYGRRGVKRARTGRKPWESRSLYKPAVPRSIMSFQRRASTQRAVHPTSGAFKFNLTGDNGVAFSFDTLGAYVNSTLLGAQFFAISGLTELAGVYEVLRLAKVEFTVLPPAVSNLWTEQTGSTPIKIPVCRSCIDYNDNDVPTLIIVNQSPTVRVDILDKKLTRTVYPKMEGSNGVIDVSVNQRNLFQQAGVASTQQWHGMKFFFDVFPTAPFIGMEMEISYKCYWECMYPK